jgi:hypothetical protein
MVRKNVFFAGLFLLFLVNFSGIFAIKLDVKINEDSEVVKLSDGSGYSLKANGEISIYNPSNVSKVYEFRLPLEFNSFIGIDKIASDSSSDKFDFNYDMIKGYMIEPNETIKTEYKIYGLLDDNLYESMNESQSVLGYYISSYDFISNVDIGLTKVSREKTLINGSNSTYNNVSQRILSVFVENPGDFEYLVNQMKIYRTISSDPYFEEGDAIKLINNVSVKPQVRKNFFFEDNDSFDNAVYWASFDIKIKSDLHENSDKNYEVEEEEPEEDEEGKEEDIAEDEDDFVFEDDNSYDSSQDDENQSRENVSIIVRKESDKFYLKNGEELEITVRIVNPNDFVLKNLSFYDEVPDEFEIKNISEDFNFSDGKLNLNIDEIDSYETYFLSYKLVLDDNISGVSYLKPAIVDYNEKEYYSQGVLILIDERFAKVRIKVKNFGNYDLRDFIVKDSIRDNVIVKDISKVFFERGGWKVDLLKAGDEWEVNYVVERNSDLQNLPNVFGVEGSDVYGNLVFSEEVVTSYKEKPNIIEKVGLSLTVGILILYLFF